jgi:hypothetical protein
MSQRFTVFPAQSDTVVVNWNGDSLAVIGWRYDSIASLAMPITVHGLLEDFECIYINGEKQ